MNRKDVETVLDLVIDVIPDKGSSEFERIFGDTSLWEDFCACDSNWGYLWVVMSAEERELMSNYIANSPEFQERVEHPKHGEQGT